MAYRVAKSLEKLLAQINEMAPNRDKASDGALGDADHQNRTSDHNPWCSGNVVTARDYDHDPLHGADMVEIGEALRESRDPRIKYVISQGRMFSSYPTSIYAAWMWRPYSGVNAHTLHMHVSVNCGPGMDDTHDWQIKRKEWDEMATKAEIREVVKAEVDRAVAELKKDAAYNRKVLAVGKTQKGYTADKINLKTLLDAK